jgi:hypothetical protein
MTRAECVALEDSGLWDQQRLELVDGELISKLGKKRRHVSAIVAVQDWLMRTFGAQFVNPEVSESRTYLADSGGGPGLSMSAARVNASDR